MVRPDGGPVLLDFGLARQEAAGETYFDAAGAPGRTLGLNVADDVQPGNAAP